MCESNLTMQQHRYFKNSSLRFNSHFSRWTGLACFIGAKDDGSGGENWSYKTCKTPANHHHQQTNTQQIYRPDALPVTQPTVSKLSPNQPNSVEALKGNDILKTKDIKVLAKFQYCLNKCWLEHKASIVILNTAVHKSESITLTVYTSLFNWCYIICY